MAEAQKQERCEANVKVVLTTDDGILVKRAFVANAKEVWLPRVHVELSDNGDGSLHMWAPEWVLRKKGFL